jgi:hypothetical protein
MRDVRQRLLAVAVVPATRACPRDYVFVAGFRFCHADWIGGMSRWARPAHIRQCRKNQVPHGLRVLHRGSRHFHVRRGAAPSTVLFSRCLERLNVIEGFQLTIDGMQTAAKNSDGYPRVMQAVWTSASSAVGSQTLQHDFRLSAGPPGKLLLGSRLEVTLELEAPIGCRRLSNDSVGLGELTLSGARALRWGLSPTDVVSMACQESARRRG